MRAFEYRVNDEDSEILGTAIILEVMITRHHAKTRRQVRIVMRIMILGTAIILEVMITRHHAKTRRQVRIVMRIMILRDKHVSEDSEQL